MADVIRKMDENHTVADIDNTIDEVADARGDYGSLNERLEDLDGGVTVYSSSDYTITPYSATDPHADYLNASATGYQIGDLQTVHITGSYTVYYAVSSDEGYKICEIDVPGTIADDEKEIAAVTDYMQYLTSGSVHCLFIAKIETVSSTKKLCIYYKSAGESHGSSGINKSFDITATFKVSG